MDKIHRTLSIILIITIQLIILALLNLSNYISGQGAFATGTLSSFMFPMNILLGILAIASIVLVRRVMESTEEEVRKQVQLESIENLESLINTMRSQRHSFNHELQTVYGLLAVEEYAEAKKYLERTMSEIAVTNNLIRLDDPGVSALLHVKSSQMESLGIKFEINIKSRLKNLPLKTHEINLILSNLLDNAMEALSMGTSQEPAIILDLTMCQNNCVLSVTNNGPGVDTSIKNKLFLPGFTTKVKNKGMGLYIVKEIIEKHNGKIVVNSDSHWTTFVIKIPIAGRHHHEPSLSLTKAGP